jgi:imidazolonepropionase-like amidohydrolase
VQQLLTARQVLIGPAGQRIDDGAVLIDNDTIIAVGARRHLERKAPPGVRRRDFPHHSLLPGLINCHVHLALDTSPDPVAALHTTSDDNLLPAMAIRARQALGAGVTTVRDLGDRGGLALRLRDAIDSGALPGPRILASGPPLTIPRGHCWFFGGEVADRDAIRRQVRDNAELGADLIKVMASGGQLTPSSPPMWKSQFSADELRLVVAEAAAAGLGVAAHAHGTDAIASSVEAGVTTIEHCTWLASGGDGYDPRDEVAQAMAERGTYACIAWPPRWRAFMDKIGAERAEQMALRFRWLDELGVRLIPGTDAGLRGSVFDDFAGALQLYEHVGFTPDRIIEMATVTSACALGRGHEIGQLAPGYSADLLVVDGDPFTSLDALQHQELVLARGREADASSEPA